MGPPPEAKALNPPVVGLVDVTGFPKLDCPNEGCQKPGFPKDVWQNCDVPNPDVAIEGAGLGFAQHSEFAKV